MGVAHVRRGGNEKRVPGKPETRYEYGGAEADRTLDLTLGDVVGKLPCERFCDCLQGSEPVVRPEGGSIPLRDRHPPLWIEVGKTEDPIALGHLSIPRQPGKIGKLSRTLM